MGGVKNQEVSGKVRIVRIVRIVSPAASRHRGPNSSRFSPSSAFTCETFTDSTFIPEYKGKKRTQRLDRGISNVHRGLS